MEFKDHFSDGAQAYVAARPRYPQALFELIAAGAPGLDTAWDCATGNGQAALALAEHFAQVEATDASAGQIGHALSHPRVRYSVQPAERTDFAGGRFDAITVAQALHWFDLDLFYREAKRVLRRGGVIAVWGYAWQRVSPEIDEVVERTLLAPLKGYWARENRLLWDGYDKIAFPFERIAVPELAMNVEWDLRQFLGYVGTWSAFRRRVAEQGDDFAREAQESIEQVWGGATRRRLVNMDFYLRMGRNNES